MKVKDYVILASLLLLAIFIWLRQKTWITSYDDTLPILIALPLFWWLGTPWRFREDQAPLSLPKVILSVVLFLIGILTNLTIILAIAWTLLLWTWLSSRTLPETHPSIKKLLILPLMSFPWISLDADRIGWWFRLSGAHITAQIFALTGFNVIQEGTNLMINNVPISVDVACAGLNTLQSMIIAGSIVAYIFLGNSTLYWWNLPLLVVMAWIANTLRIILLSAAALIISPEFATGSFHTWGGWGVLILMFLLCWLLFSLQKNKIEKITS